MRVSGFDGIQARARSEKDAGFQAIRRGSSTPSVDESAAKSHSVAASLLSISARTSRAPGTPGNRNTPPASPSPVFNKR